MGCGGGYSSSMRNAHTLLLLLLLLVVFSPASAQFEDVKAVNSRFYTIHTDLSREEVGPIAAHMDAIFQQYTQRFAGFRSRRRGSMPLYLFKERDTYLAFMQRVGIDASGSGGMFFVMPDAQGLATWTDGRGRRELYEVLQHEGFHQFAYDYIGPALPVWVNEGIAQYYEDAIIVGSRMKMGLANARRIDLVKRAIENSGTIPVQELTTMTGNVWAAALRGNPERASLQYAQSWSIVYFLIHAEDGKYQSAFIRYLNLVSNGRNTDTAFAQAFGTSDTTAMQARWLEFAKTQEVDELTRTMERMEFLGQGLLFLHGKEGVTPPGSLDDLKRELQRRRFRVTRSTGGLETTYDAADEELYRFQPGKGEAMAFELLPPSREGLPPRVRATGLSPVPVLEWSRNEEGEPVAEIEFR